MSRHISLLHWKSPVRPKAAQKVLINEFLTELEIEFGCLVGLHNKSIKAMNKT